MCSHVGVMFDWEANKQQLLQGHVSCYVEISQFFLVMTLYCLIESFNDVCGVVQFYSWFKFYFSLF